MTSPIALIDYGAGNLASVAHALHAVGAPVEIIGCAAELANFDRALLPGVGNFGEGMEFLRSTGFDQALLRFRASGGALFGICLGMQMLFEGSEEAPGVAGLGVLPGVIRRFPTGKEKVPHVGWNEVRFNADSGLPEAGRSEHFYFVHSYCAPVGEATCGVCEYGISFTAAVHSGRWFATQFHPEKSQRAGLRLLARFAGGPEPLLFTLKQV